MWDKSYRDYKKDEPLVKQGVESGRGIVGCEMHEPNGWGETFHIKPPRKQGKGLIRTLLDSSFNFFKGRGKA